MGIWKLKKNVSNRNHNLQKNHKYATMLRKKESKRQKEKGRLGIFSIYWKIFFFNTHNQRCILSYHIIITYIFLYYIVSYVGVDWYLCCQLFASCLLLGWAGWMLASQNHQNKQHHFSLFFLCCKKCSVDRKTPQPQMLTLFSCITSGTY